MCKTCSLQPKRYFHHGVFPEKGARVKAFLCGGFLMGFECGDTLETVTQGRWCARLLLEVASLPACVRNTAIGRDFSYIL